MICRTFITLIAILGATVVGAENRWVTDEFEVMMRSGTSTRQSIVRQLKSGTQLEMLEVDAESGYTKVRTASGSEGWVLSRLKTPMRSCRWIRRSLKSWSVIQTGRPPPGTVPMTCRACGADKA